MTMLDNRFSRSRNVEIMVLTKMKMRKKEEDDDYSRLSLANIDDVEEPPPLPAEKHFVVKEYPALLNPKIYSSIMVGL